MKVVEDVTVEPRKWATPISINPSRRPSLKEDSEQLIRRLLVSGDMRPGQLYSANSLASQLGISNSPVREAMLSLSAEGLLEPVRNRGFRVVEMTPKDRQEVYDLRRLIEVEAVRRAASRHLTKDEANTLTELAHHALDLLPDTPGGDLIPYLDADNDFHCYLVGLIGNTRWSDMVRILRDQSRINGAYRHLGHQERDRASAEEHIDIAHAVIRGDAVLAADLMVRHLDYARPQS
ncbi:FCD domain-containing protein [Corynebacterium poyangense]|uniref:FCD domain-containing protein n=1 Tax=Corynebacterium poyangense TaxID=2684405 RepID=A0A7H0SQM6_9CORY|nr:GntR family transcriptional regulator [Corynebacterium poyangense]MBZ8178255.1 FCD domain-containing protein [Corynebacterium poyangense]QNQ90851.1 FCD domain-containing protein [Corynebacterium poyangense]